MDAANLTSADFWQSGSPVVLANDRDSRACAQSELLELRLADQLGLSGHLLFATSGSTGTGKWVALSREALLVSAAAVNEHLGCSNSDHWLLALPVFHVGGMGIMARAYQSGASVTRYEGSWDAVEFHKMLVVTEATLTSLVPTQIMDLMQLELPAPPALRGVLVGGGALSDDAYARAVNLGWPILETYGMTETGSQVATASHGERDMKLLSCWQARTNEDDLLELQGSALMSSYIYCEGNDLRIENPFHGGWFTTRDRVSLSGDSLQFLGRADRSVKVLGELVDLAHIEKRFSSVPLYMVAVPHPRSGHSIVACGDRNTKPVSKMIEQYNSHCNPVERIVDVMFFPNLPISPLGKIKYAELTEWVRDKTKSK